MRANLYQLLRYKSSSRWYCMFCKDLLYESTNSDGNIASMRYFHKCISVVLQYFLICLFIILIRHGNIRGITKIKNLMYLFITHVISTNIVYACDEIQM